MGLFSKPVRWIKKQTHGGLKKGLSASGLKSTLKGTGKTVGKVVDNKWTKLAAAAALTATGVGAPAAAAIIGGMSAGGKLAQGKRLTTAAKGGLKDAALTYVGNKVGGKILNRMAPNVGASGVDAGGGGYVDRAKQMMGGLFKGGGSDGKGNFGRVGDFAGRALNPGSGSAPGDGGGMGWMDKILMGGTIAAGAEDSFRRRQMQDQAVDYARGSYDGRAPLRSRAMAMLEKDVRPDHSATFADPGNVYARPRAQLMQESVAQ